MIHSQKMVGFVAKREIAGWPLVGWVASRGHTIYHQRGNTESLGGVMEEMAKRLREGRPVAVFPEGRTRGGDSVLVERLVPGTHRIPGRRGGQLAVDQQHRGAVL